MKKNAGILTALAAVLAFFGLSNLPKNSSGGQAKTETRNGAKPATAVHPPVISSPCQAIQKRLQSIVADTPDEQWRAPDFCYPDNRVPNVQKLSASNVVFVIATAPNPLVTHLPLLFDRVVEIIQQAAQDSKYSYDSSWLPWNQTKEYSSLADQLAAESAQSLEESEPGVLVFRRLPEKATGPFYKGGLAVFIVAELPTGGLNQKQFENAVAWIDELGGFSEGHKLNILGPTFSGSLPSLYRSLHFPQVTSSLGESSERIRISSGSVSSDAGYKWFTKKLRDERLGSFETAMEGDSVLLRRFCEYIHSQGYQTEHVAVLSEDETAFGGVAEDRLDNPNDPSDVERDKSKDKDKDKDGDGPTYLYYPRDIATLRSAYEEQSILSSPKQQTNTTLRGDLSELESIEHDTVRSYGGQLTPLAQESLLLTITDVLREKKIEFVVLRSTNSLDQVFLCQFLRRSLPEARLVIDGSDLLFRRGAEGSSLRGVMVLSTYPLLVWQQDWTSSQLPGSPSARNGQSYRIFGEDVAEGLYIAARGLFDDQGSEVPIANYAPPAWARTTGEGDDARPPTWLTVIGHRQFWPVAVLDSQTLVKSKATSLLPTTPMPNNSWISIYGDPFAMRLVPLEFWILLLLCFAWSFLHLLWCARGSISPLPASFRLAYFAPVSRWQHPALIGFGSTLVAAVAVVVVTIPGLFTWKPTGWNEFVVAASVLAILLCAYGACATNYTLPPMSDAAFTNHDARISRLVAAWVSLGLVGAFLLVRVGFLLQLTKANKIPVFWRSVHLVSGVSPLLPQLFLVAGMYLWFWFGLRGLALFGNDRPFLPKESDLKLTDGTPTMPMFSREQLAKPVEDRALPLGGRYLATLGVIFPIVVVVCGIALHGIWLRTLGERSFGIFIFFWLTFSIALILADTAQCWSTWKNLQVLLIYLDRLPLRRTLNALQGLSWRSVWAMSGNVLAERYCMVSRQIEAMRHLGNQIDLWIPDDPSDAENKMRLQEKIRACQKQQLKALIAWYERLNGESVICVQPLRDLQEEIASIAALVLTTVLIPSWQAETSSLLVDTSRTRNAEADGPGGPAISPNVPPYVLAAEEFVVLPYVGFIQNILGRIRSTVIGTLFLFVASTLAVSSYPFDPLPVLGGIFLAVFTLTGTTLIVIYAGMHRDATLSYITGTRAGELGLEFWRQLITFGAGPLLGLLTTLFPSITDFITSWLQPSTQVMK
jgi:hypothetical protein